MPHRRKQWVDFFEGGRGRGRGRKGADEERGMEREWRVVGVAVRGEGEEDFFVLRFSGCFHREPDSVPLLTGSSYAIPQMVLQLYREAIWRQSHARTHTHSGNELLFLDLCWRTWEGEKSMDPPPIDEPFNIKARKEKKKEHRRANLLQTFPFWPVCCVSTGFFYLIDISNHMLTYFGLF